MALLGCPRFREWPVYYDDVGHREEGCATGDDFLTKGGPMPGELEVAFHAIRAGASRGLAPGRLCCRVYRSGVYAGWFCDHGGTR
jgi:hypothetical protein